MEASTSTQSDQILNNISSYFLSFMQEASMKLMKLNAQADELANIIVAMNTPLPLPVPSPQQAEEQAEEKPKILNINHSLIATDASNSEKKNQNSTSENLFSSSSSSELRLEVQGLEKKWFTRKQFPSFEVTVVNSLTSQVFTETNEWNVIVSLVSGHGGSANDVITTTSVAQSSAQGHKGGHGSNIPSGGPISLPLINGHVNVSGIRFLSVSSRNGDYFAFDISLQKSAGKTKKSEIDQVLSKVPTWRSHNILIRSERLVSETKVESVLQLSPEDILTKVPGIGKTYAQKFASLGITTVRDLASVDTPKSNFTFVQLLEKVKKDRGALTEDKLTLLLKEAKIVVHNADMQQEQEHEQHSENESSVSTVSSPCSSSSSSSSPIVSEPSSRNNIPQSEVQLTQYTTEQALLKRKLAELSVINTNMFQSSSNPSSPVPDLFSPYVRSNSNSSLNSPRMSSNLKRPKLFETSSTEESEPLFFESSNEYPSTPNTQNWFWTNEDVSLMLNVVEDDDDYEVL